MRRILTTIVAAILAPAAWASYAIEDTQIHCSDTFSASFGSALKLTCSGDLSLQGTSALSRIGASDSIELFASGQLKLNQLRLSAPSLTLKAGDGFDAGNPGWIRSVTGEISLRGRSDVTLFQPSHIQVLSVAGAVPEPSAWLLVCLGAIGVMVWQRQRAHR